MTQRLDLVSEVDTTMDSSGSYVGPWLDSSGIPAIRLTAKGTGTFDLSIEESSDQTNVLGTELVATGPEVRGVANLAARYFRLKVANSTTGSAFRASIRATA